MTIYDRPDEQVMAESALAGEVQVFPDIPRGWGVTFDQTGGIPPMEWFNYLARRTDQAIRYFLQRGLPEWSATETYPQGAYVQYAFQTYYSKRENKNKQPGAAGSSNDWGRWSVTRDEFDAGTTGRLLAIRVFSTPGTFPYNRSEGTNKIRVRLQGGGGAGAGSVACGSAQVSVGGGGSSGSYAESFLTGGFDNQLIVVGNGGTPVVGGSGGSGGASSFGALMSAPGGLGAPVAGSPFSIPGMYSGAYAPAIASGGSTVNQRGGAGGYGIVTTVQTGSGVCNSGNGGASAFGPGGDGRGASLTGPGFAATAPGAGGGAAMTMTSGAAQVGGAGAPGIVIIEEYA